MRTVKKLIVYIKLYRVLHTSFIKQFTLFICVITSYYFLCQYTHTHIHTHTHTYTHTHIHTHTHTHTHTHEFTTSYRYSFDVFPVNRSLTIVVSKTFILKVVKTYYFKINYIRYYYII